MRSDGAAARKESNVYVLDPAARERNRLDRGGSDVLDPVIAQARECLRQEANAVATLAQRLDESFLSAIRLLFSCRGHVIISGLGKSGLVGRKIAATLASTGTPSFFMHSGEALHGDLGMVTGDDVVVLISYSGETREVLEMMRHLAARQIPTLALVGRVESSLGVAADVVLDVSVDSEACPNDVAPTSSTLAALAMGDALAVALIKLRGFGARDFAQLHPGGSVGRKLTHVGEAAATDGVTVLAPDEPVREAVLALASSELPLALVCDGTRLLGVLEVRDVRAAGDCMDAPVSDVMNARPRVLPASTPLPEADALLERDDLSAVVVIDSSGNLCGVYATASQKQRR